MKKILFLTNIPSPYRVDFFNELGKAPEMDVTVVFLVHPEENTGREKSWFHEHYLHFRPVFCKDPIRLPGGRKLYPSIREELKKSWDEIVFCGYVYPTMLYAMRWLKRHGIPYSIEIDGGLIKPESFLRRRFKTRVLSSGARWYSSGPVSDVYLTHYGAEEKRIVLYPFASVRAADCVDGKLLCREEKLRRRGQLGIQEKTVLLSIGQFIPRKGFDLLLKAAVHLPPTLGIYLIGGDATPEYRALVSENGLTNVHFVSFLSKQELWNYYLAADLFVLPTREDIWGLVVNEAMACGLPVLTTDRCVAGLELVENHKNGLIVRADDVNALESGIKELLACDLSQLGLNALETAKHYTVETMAEAHLDALGK